MIPYQNKEKASCGVGFIVDLNQQRTNDVLKKTLDSLCCVEHRGGTGDDGHIGDGSGIMTAIPFELFGYEEGTVAIASLFTPSDPERHKKSLEVFENTFHICGLEVIGYREVPIDKSVLSPLALNNMPILKHAIIQRPEHCRTLTSFEKLLYAAKQLTRTTEKEAGIYKEFFFSSLSPHSIVYKALCVGADLQKFYLDLQNPLFKTNYGLFHRRFSTNTTSTWDKVQPFRVIAHNGEINTIEGNKTWSITREKALGLRQDELITHEGISDSGSLNGIVEALKYRSSIPKISEILSILIPPANKDDSYYNFWGRGMEPWDGPALVSYCDGKTIGARLDRNGLRPCRWTKTKDFFYLCSETGTFPIADEEVEEKGSLFSGGSVNINIKNGEVSFLDASKFPDNIDAFFEAHVYKFDYQPPTAWYKGHLHNLGLFHYSKEDLETFIDQMVKERKEPIGSMGDTAKLAFLSDEPRSFFDFFYQDFAQVTNPPFDYIREKAITDMRVYLGRKPNIFEPKEFIPIKPALGLEGPVLSLGQYEYLLENNPVQPSLRVTVFKTLFDRNDTPEQFSDRLKKITDDCIKAVQEGTTIIVLSDRKASKDKLPIPSLLILREVTLGLNRSGLRLRTSVIVDSGEIKNSHHISCLLGFGASAVCPYLLLERAYFDSVPALQNIFPRVREKRVIAALNSGVLRIMAKMGISVLRSYQGSQLFTVVGLGKDIMDRFFPGQVSPVGGLSLEKVMNRIVAFSGEEHTAEIVKSFLFKEHPTGKLGEVHSLTSKRSRLIHKMIEEADENTRHTLFKEFANEIYENPCFIRHLFNYESKSQAESLQSVEDILTTFGSGGMSFGAISAESQRDLIEAFREINGHCNSGEGGENPYYFTDGLYANIKQMASGRFGVTCEYLITGDEVQIKIAQGAKPGEGGQLMGPKVTEEIAKARYSTPGVDLISPPPQHDIYSIEDLKQLIYEIRQLKPSLRVSVKLVSGKNIGAIAVGVVKAGADIIQISGGDGGTGAASLLSMKHAGLPLEIGLAEVHHALVSANMRDKVLLRVDGGLMTGKDIVTAAILGGDQFDFGKIVLVAEGCIMARICEKNTCPTGIATHDPKFKEKYKGDKTKVVTFLKELAYDVQENLKSTGFGSLKELRGRMDLLKIRDEYQELVDARGFDIGYFSKLSSYFNKEKPHPYYGPNSLNKKIVKAVNEGTECDFVISNVDRAVPASLAGLFGNHLAKSRHGKDFVHWAKLEKTDPVQLTFRGSAGHGFGIFLPKEVSIKLYGEANDFVGKGLCGGKIEILPPKASSFKPEENSILGNCALYGATGGELIAQGIGGDRFAVRNSGAEAIIEGVGIHALEYMTGGKVIILGRSLGNIGAGMTGGTLYINSGEKDKVNLEYLVHVPFLAEDMDYVIERLEYYIKVTSSESAKQTLKKLKAREFPLIKYIPIGLSTASE